MFFQVSSPEAVLLFTPKISVEGENYSKISCLATFFSVIEIPTKEEVDKSEKP